VTQQDKLIFYVFHEYRELNHSRLLGHMSFAKIRAPTTTTPGINSLLDPFPH
jgi:hypothetical protein